MMAAEEAVFTAAVARDEVRKSLMRMEYHMSRGPAGLRGVTREQNDNRPGWEQVPLGRPM